jgi:uncharacterized protein YbjT (DUF2867 family)
MKIIITGSLGNISKPLTEELLHKGHKVTVISSNTNKKHAIEALGANSAIGDLYDVDFVTTTFTGADAVYCMLPPFDYFDPKINVMEAAGKLATVYAQAILNSGVKQVIHLSSVGAHTNKGNGLLAFHYLAESILKDLPADVNIIHMRPTGFYNNIYHFKDTIKGKGFIGIFLTLRYLGLGALLTGKRGVIAANYGGNDMTPWVSPKDIAAAIAEKITTIFKGRQIQYIVSEELKCNEVASIIGAAVGKPWLKWVTMSDKEMLGGLKMFGMTQSTAEGMVEMNAGIHSGLVDEDYHRNKPKVMGKVKLKDFAKEFAVFYNQ